MKEILSGIGIVVGIIILIAIGKNWNRIFTPSKLPANNLVSGNNEMTCTLRGASGNIITIAGSSTDPQFVNMCRNSFPNQQYYVYGYPYYFINTRRHRWHHNGNGDDNGNS